MELLIQLLINGLVTGAALALVAIGFALIFGMTHQFHFAHGSVFQVAAYSAYVAANLLKLPFVIAIVISLAVAILLGVVIEKFIYRPMEKAGAPDTAILMCSLGILIVVQNILAIAFGLDNLPLTDTQVGESLVFGTIVITPVNLITIIVAILILILLQWFLKRTKTGHTMQAVAENREMAEVVGIDVQKVVLKTFVLGSVLAVPAAILLGLNKGVTIDMGFSAMLIAPIAVIVGGIGSIPGAIFGSFVIGILQNVGLWKIDGIWQSTIAFGILLVVIIVKPTGLFGRGSKLQKKGV